MANVLQTELARKMLKDKCDKKNVPLIRFLSKTDIAETMEEYANIEFAEWLGDNSAAPQDLLEQFKNK